MPSKRSGILAGGNFIVDSVKMIDSYPAENMLASIASESRANGGGPYNVLKDLAAMGAGFPLEAAGRVGEDANGRWILQDCQAHYIDTRQLRATPGAPTSYTDVMTVAATGRRTFFHQRGANALLEAAHFDFTQTQARLFHLAYLMLLDSLDVVDSGGSTPAAAVLQRARQAGLQTSVDIVSTENPWFGEIARAAFPFADHLVINEIEAGKILGRALCTGDLGVMKEAAVEILGLGVGEAVVLHFESGAVAAEKTAAPVAQGSLQLPAGFSQGASGAGDAFAAGYLYGVHEGWPMAKRLELAVCTAAACLTDATPSAGLRPIADCLALGRRYPARAVL